MSQPLAALSKANSVKARRAEVRTHLGSLPRSEARREAAELLADLPPELESWQVCQFLRAPAGMGHSKGDAILRRAGILNPLLPLGALTERQADALSAALKEGS